MATDRDPCRFPETRRDCDTLRAPDGWIAELPRWQRRVLRVAHAVEPTEHPTEAIYGTLIAAAVIATNASGGKSGLAAFLTALVVLSLYWLAHVYSDVLGERLASRSRPGWRSIIRTALRDWALLRGALLPIAIFGATRLLFSSVETAALTALWCTVFLFGCWGFVAALRGGAKGLELIVETVACAGFGVFVIVLKTVIH